MSVVCSRPKSFPQGHHLPNLLVRKKIFVTFEKIFMKASEILPHQCCTRPFFQVVDSSNLFGKASLEAAYKES